MRYYREHPDEPISHDWYSRRPNPCQPSVISAQFSQHVQECERCRKSLIAVTEDLEQPLTLCDEGKRLLAQIFN